MIEDKKSLNLFFVDEIFIKFLAFLSIMIFGRGSFRGAF